MKHFSEKIEKIFLVLNLKKKENEIFDFNFWNYNWRVWKKCFFIIKNQKNCCEKNPVARNVLKLKQQLQDNLQIINRWISKKILDDPEHELIGKYLGTNVIYSQNKRFVKSMIIYIFNIFYWMILFIMVRI